MLLADSNVWLALALSKHMFHAAVRTPISPSLHLRVTTKNVTTDKAFKQFKQLDLIVLPRG
jgi:predicted nucleic acid-binding protein